MGGAAKSLLFPRGAKRAKAKAEVKVVGWEAKVDALCAQGKDEREP